MPEAGPIQPAAAAPPAAVPTARTAPSESLETRVGLHWINRAGILTLILGCAFFFKYAVDNAWIGATGRVVLGALTGLAALALGERFSRRRQRVFAQGLLGLGLAVLYITIAAAFSLYHFLSQPPALLLMALTTLLACALSLRHDAPAISVLGLVGGYLTPLLLDTGADPGSRLFFYLLVLNGGVAWMAVRRNWPLVHALGLAFTAVLFADWAIRHSRADNLWAGVVFCFAAWAEFAISPAEGVAALAHILFGAALTGLLYPRHGLAFAGLFPVPVLGSLALSAARRWRWLPAATALAYWLCLVVWSWPEGRNAVFVSATAAFLLWAAWLPGGLLLRGLQPKAGEFLLPPVNAVFYFTLGYLVLARDASGFTGLFAVGVAAVHLAAAAMVRAVSPRLAALAAGIALFFLTAAIPIQFTGFPITLGWALMAAALAWLSTRFREEPRLVAAAFVLYALVLIRLAFDAQIAIPNLFVNRRFLAFSAAAASLFLGGWWWRERRLAMLPYFLGHSVFLAALTAQFLALVKRHASPAAYPSAAAAVVSIVFAVYAVGFIAGGVATRTAVNRGSGLILFGVILLKLYFYDVWLLDRFYRVLAFLALGGLLVLGSYLYSRYRERIGALWRARGPSAA